MTSFSARQKERALVALRKARGAIYVKLVFSPIVAHARRIRGHWTIEDDQPLVLGGNWREVEQEILQKSCNSW